MAKKKTETIPEAEVATAVPEVKPKRKAKPKKKTATYSGRKWNIVGDTPDGMVVLSDNTGSILIVSAEDI